MLVVAAFALLAVAGTTSASTKQELNAVFSKYGFEYRDAERPYGLPIKARLTRVKIGNDKYQLDLASPLTRQGVDAAIHDYLVRHVANELQVINMLAGEPIGNIKVDPNKAFVEELHTSLIKPPFESWRARIEPFTNKGATIEAHCDFHFVRLEGKYYQLYFQDWSSYKTSKEPSCDLRRSDYHHNG